MNKNEFIIGDEYIYSGSSVSMEYVSEPMKYVSESLSPNVGRFVGKKETYHCEYRNMTPCTKVEPKYPNPPLPHCEERIAFAKGANIEFENRCGTHSKWMFTGDPKWHANIKYRVKLGKTQDDLRIEKLEENIRAHENYIKQYIEELADLKPTVHY